ncbi:MAG TPA: hypothetical protein VGS78_04165 [Candidatus Sulfotelmatobacter sp.]|nr:hypothetical protein [Candidatus Sulfotelmatobacter sp.]
MRPVFPRHLALLLLPVLVILAVGILVAAQDQVRRLILKDGSYQLVTKYEVKGDRVHYYSSEREEWEELPNSLVDWPATEKWQKDRAAMASSPEAVALDKELAHEEELADTKLPEVAPGLRLPEPEGIFLLDNYGGEPQINELQQTAGDIDRNAKGNIFRGAINPIAGLKQVIELDGDHAKIQAHVDVPAIYINVNDVPDQVGLQPETTRSSRSAQQPQQREQAQQPQQAAVPFDRFRIVRTEIKGKKRILGDIKRQVTGKVTQDEHLVKTTVTQVNGGWLKLTPTEALAPGEYALVEMVGEKGMNLDVWDFGVNPKAPANANPWKPEAKQQKAEKK